MTKKPKLPVADIAKGQKNRRKPNPIPGRVSNAELQHEIDETNRLIAKLKLK